MPPAHKCAWERWCLAGVRPTEILRHPGSLWLYSLISIEKAVASLSGRVLQAIPEMHKLEDVFVVKAVPHFVLLGVLALISSASSLDHQLNGQFT